MCPTCQSCQAVVLSRSQASEESRVGLDPKPGTEGADGVEWLNKGKAWSHRSPCMHAVSAISKCLS